MSDSIFDTASSEDLCAFQDLVLTRGTELYRDLPWRGIDDAYAVMLSEVMLQQTQVVRVIDRWNRFLKRFPTIDAVAAADTASVVEEWMGLGYNRRALMLKRTCDECARSWDGHMPYEERDLLALPGIGPATAAGIRAFAYQQPSVYIETNVRTVVIHHFFPDVDDVHDRDIAPIVKATCVAQDPRRWYYAMLDYGAWLKKTAGNAGARAKSYTRQSKFEGSRRQKRAEMLRIVMSNGAAKLEDIIEALNAFEKEHGREAVSNELVQSILDDLVRDGFFIEDAGVTGVYRPA